MASVIFYSLVYPLPAGESVVRKEFVEKRDWQAITEVARQYVQKLPAKTGL
jgi:2-keto-3-deoxy-6-phosphogluconate aldolase